MAPAGLGPAGAYTLFVTLPELEKAALELDHRSRARLAERLLESLDALSEGEVEALWLEEAERRAAAWDAGEFQGISAEDVVQAARSAE